MQHKYNVWRTIANVNKDVFQIPDFLFLLPKSNTLQMVIGPQKVLSCGPIWLLEAEPMMEALFENIFLFQ